MLYLFGVSLLQFSLLTLIMARNVEHFNHRGWRNYMCLYLQLKKDVDYCCLARLPFRKGLDFFFFFAGLLFYTFWKKIFAYTAENTEFSTKLLVRKFCRNARFPQSFGWIANCPKLFPNCAFTQNVYNKKLGEITALHSVLPVASLSVLHCFKQKLKEWN